MTSSTVSSIAQNAGLTSRPAGGRPQRGGRVHRPVRANAVQLIFIRLIGVMKVLLCAVLRVLWMLAIRRVREPLS